MKGYDETCDGEKDKNPQPKRSIIIIRDSVKQTVNGSVPVTALGTTGE